MTADTGPRGRRPLMAGNWKMYKTQAEATAFVRRVRPLVADVDDRDVLLCGRRRCCLETALAATAGAPWLVGAQTMHYAAEGAYTGEISRRRCSSSSASTPSSSVTPSAVSTSPRTTPTWRRRCASALDSGLLPVLCCGETRRRARGGQTESKIGGQIDADLAAGRAPTSSAAVAVAYEPIWAIGTGKTATPEMAQETVGFIRRGCTRALRRRRRPGPHPLRRQRQVVEHRRSSWPSPTSTACSSAARVSTRPSSRASRASSRGVSDARGGAGRRSDAGRGRPDAALSPAGRAFRPVVLMVLDGWGYAQPADRATP